MKTLSMKSFVVSLFTILTVHTSAMAADDWSHARVQSRDGSVIRIDFQAKGFHSGSWSALPAWINVENRQFSGNERVRVVLVQGLWEDPRHPSENPETEYGPTIVVDLDYAGDGRFTANLGQSIALNTIGQVSGALRQKLAIVVDGNWLIDPVTGRGNFMLNLACAVNAIAWMCN